MCQCYFRGKYLAWNCESQADTVHLNENYIKGLGKLSELEPEELNATEKEDEYAQNIIDNQNILAIMTAARAHNWLLDSLTPGAKRISKINRRPVPRSVSTSVARIERAQ